LNTLSGFELEMSQCNHWRSSISLERHISAVYTWFLSLKRAYDNNGRRPRQKLFLADYSSSSDKIIIMEIVGLQNTYLYFHLFIYFLKLIQVFSFPV